MKNNTLLAISLFMTLSVLARESVIVDDQAFFLSHSDIDKELGSIKEFLPGDEDLNDWVTMVAIREFSKSKSPKKYINNMAAEYRKLLPHMEFAIMQKPDTKIWMIDYIMYPYGKTSGHVEWNYFLAKPNPNGKGIIVDQLISS